MWTERMVLCDDVSPQIFQPVENSSSGVWTPARSLAEWRYLQLSLRHKGYSVLRGSCISYPSQRMCRPPLDLRVRATNAVNSGEKHKSFSTTPSLQVHIVGHLTVSTTNIDENFDLFKCSCQKWIALHQINLYLPPVVEKLDSAIQRISVRETNCPIQSIVIYPVDSVIHLLKNWGLVDKTIGLPIILYLWIALSSVWTTGARRLLSWGMGFLKVTDPWILHLVLSFLIPDWG